MSAPYRNPLAAALDARRAANGGELDPLAFLAVACGIGPNAVPIHEVRHMAAEEAWAAQMTAPPQPSALSMVPTVEQHTEALNNTAAEYAAKQEARRREMPTAMAAFLAGAAANAPAAAPSSMPAPSDKGPPAAEPFPTSFAEVFRIKMT